MLHYQLILSLIQLLLELGEVSTLVNHDDRSRSLILLRTIDTNVTERFSRSCGRFCDKGIWDLKCHLWLRRKIEGNFLYNNSTLNFCTTLGPRNSVDEWPVNWLEGKKKKKEKLDTEFGITRMSCIRAFTSIYPFFEIFNKVKVTLVFVKN
jgi:hypothetical protein